MAKKKQKENNCIIAVGIDVAKDSLSACLVEKTGQCRDLTLDNIEADINWLFNEYLVGYKGKVVMESTGRHHLLLAILLSKAGLDVRVINPLLAKKYQTGGIRKVKTDKKDGRLLAEMAIHEKRLPSRFNPNLKRLYLRKKINLAASLEKQLQGLKSVLKDYASSRNTLQVAASKAENAIQESVKELTRQKDKLEREIEILGREVCQKSVINRFQSIPGISRYVATVSSQFFQNNKQYLNSSKQWIAYAGMDLSIKQSGNWQGQSKLSKRGSAYMRKRLYCAAWGAVMHNDQFNKYYYHLKENEGRKHTEALVIIARKLLRTMFQLTKNKQIFNPDLLVLPA